MLSILFRLIPVVVLFLSVCAGPGSAALLIEESFDYADGPLTGQSGGVGWADPWSNATGFNIVGGLSFGTLDTSGGAAQGFTANVGLEARRRVGINGPSSLWASFLYRSDLNSGVAQEINALWKRDGGTGGNQAYRMEPEPFNLGTAAAFGVDRTQITGNSSLQFSDGSGQTWLFLAQMQGLNTASSASGTMWVLNVAQFASALAEAIAAGEDDAAWQNALHNHYTDRIIHTGADGTLFDPSDYLSLRLFGGNGGSNFTRATFDELRYGSSAADVLPYTYPAPEPSTALLLVLGAACGGWWSKHRRKRFASERKR